MKYSKIQNLHTVVIISTVDMMFLHLCFCVNRDHQDHKDKLDSQDREEIW